MKAIRGATTVAADTPEEIRGAVKELLEEIVKKNGLQEEDILCILFQTRRTSVACIRQRRHGRLALRMLHSILL